MLLLGSYDQKQSDKEYMVNLLQSKKNPGVSYYNNSPNIMSSKTIVEPKP